MQRATVGPCELGLLRVPPLGTPLIPPPELSGTQTLLNCSKCFLLKREMALIYFLTFYENFLLDVETEMGQIWAIFLHLFIVFVFI